MNSLLIYVLITLVAANALFFAPLFTRSLRSSPVAPTAVFLWPYRLFAGFVIGTTPLLGFIVAGIVAPDSELPFIAITFATFVLMMLQARGYNAVEEPGRVNSRDGSIVAAYLPAGRRHTVE